MKKLLLILPFWVAVMVLVPGLRAQVVVIANPGVKAASLSKSELRDIFTGDSSSLKDGSHVSPVLLKQGATHDGFLSTYVGKTDSALRASWRSLVFSGQAVMPKTLDSENAVVEYVGHNPGAIGYVSKATAHEGVKVMAVQ